MKPARLAFALAAALLLPGCGGDEPAPAPGKPAAPDPSGPGPAPPPPHAKDAGASAAKVHFMRKFVAALAEPSENLAPSPAYAPLLKAGAEPIRCTDCHKSMDVPAKLATDPGDEAAQRFRMDREQFMIPLMEKWVERLNQRHKDRLAKEVLCTDCHAFDPRDEAAGRAAFAPLMDAFVRALVERPANADPAKAWKPLLKPGAAVTCASCHGEERSLAAAPPSTGPGLPREAMIRLMERWVRELNRRMGQEIVHAIGCIDCHEIDPRK